VFEFALGHSQHVDYEDQRFIENKPIYEKLSAVGECPTRLFEESHTGIIVRRGR
jgi:hypothetical protein